MSITTAIAIHNIPEGLAICLVLIRQKDFVNEGVVVAIRDGREVVTYRHVIRAKHVKQLGVPDDFEYIPIYAENQDWP